MIFPAISFHSNGGFPLPCLINGGYLAPILDRCLHYESPCLKQAVPQLPEKSGLLAAYFQKCDASLGETFCSLTLFLVVQTFPGPLGRKLTKLPSGLFHFSKTLSELCQLVMGQNLVPLVNPKIAGKWMFIPLELIIIGFDPPPAFH